MFWPNLQQPWADVRDVVDHAERSGWDGVYLADHFMGDGGGFGPVEMPTLEATAALAALAATTDRLRLGSLVFGNTYRHPAVLANWAATTDQISRGRLVLGIGAGWQENEHCHYGIRLPPPGERVRRFAEACEVLVGLLRQPTTSLEGTHYHLDEAVCEPKPFQDPLPLLIGAKGDRMLDVVANWADIWNMWGLPETIAERATALERATDRIGRDPASIERSCQALVFVTDDRARAAELVDLVAPRAAVGGPPERFAEVVAGWVDAGVDEVVVPDFTLGRGSERRERMDLLLEAARSVIGPGDPDP